MMTDLNTKYLNRELSWLEFNQRVLEEALDPELPLLERLKFVAIAASNLDEFFRVRVGGLRMLVDQGVTKADPAGLSPREQLEAISQRVKVLLSEQYQCFCDDLEPQLTKAGIRRMLPEELSDTQREAVSKQFEGEIWSVLAPIAVTGPEDIPHLPTQSLNVCVRLMPDARKDAARARFAIIPLGTTLSRFVRVPSTSEFAYLLLEDVVKLFVSQFFDGETVSECVPFRITRNADLELREDQAADLMAEMEQMLDARKLGECIRLEVPTDTSAGTLDFLCEALGVGPTEVNKLPGPLDFTAYFFIAERPGFDRLKLPSWTPQRSPRIEPGQTMFDTISEGDVLLYHPYESYDPIVRLVNEAADDPDVLAIKQTLYRTSRDSPIVAALTRAAESGKHVTVVVELKARFDEARNIRWALRLQQAGAHVIYGVKGLKTHAKVCIVVRREADGIRRYLHFGTGNYNEATARLYSDTGLLTRDEELAGDAVAFFNAITGYSQPQRTRRISAAPLTLRDSVLAMIDGEIRHCGDHQKARVTAKMNALVDPKIINKLYDASQAGVEVRLNIRGICCLRPGVPGLSENIEVISIVDRYLEHARIFDFFNGGEHRVFISSADWMPRNLDKRVELMVPVDDVLCARQLREILEVYFRDNVKSRRLLPDGTYERLTPEGRPPFRAQEVLYRRACERVREADQQRRTVFVPHQAPEMDL